MRVCTDETKGVCHKTVKTVVKVIGSHCSCEVMVEVGKVMDKNHV